MTLKREIKDAYLEGGNSIYVKTHSNAVYVDDNETETLTQRLDNVKSSITKHTSQLNDIMKNNVISPLQYGAIGDGIADDIAAIQEAITECQNSNKLLYFPSGYTFAVSSPVEITKRINVQGYGSELKALNKIDSLFCVNEDIYYDGTGTALENRLDLFNVATIQGLKLNCNNFANCGLYAKKSLKVHYENINIVNCKNTSIIADQITECVFDKIDIIASYSTESIGILVTGNDANFSNINIIDCHTAIKTNRTNFYSRIHAWILHNSLCQGSTFFYMYDATILTNRLSQCYCDTYQYCFKGNKQKQNVQVSQFHYIFNETIYPRNLQPYLFFAEGDSTDFFFSWSSINDSYLQGSDGLWSKICNFNKCVIKLDSSNFYEHISEIKKITNSELSLCQGVTLNKYNRIIRDGANVSVLFSLTLSVNDLIKSYNVANIAKITEYILYPINALNFNVSISDDDNTSVAEVKAIGTAYLQGNEGDDNYSGLLRLKIPDSLSTSSKLYIRGSVSYINSQLINSSIKSSDVN